MGLSNMTVIDEFEEATKATTLLGHWDVEDHTDWKEEGLASGEYVWASRYDKGR